MFPKVKFPRITSALPAYTVRIVLRPIRPMIRGKNNDWTFVSLRDCFRYISVSTSNRPTDSCSRLKDFKYPDPAKGFLNKRRKFRLALLDLFGASFNFIVNQKDTQRQQRKGAQGIPGQQGANFKHERD